MPRRRSPAASKAHAAPAVPSPDPAAEREAHRFGLVLRVAVAAFVALCVLAPASWNLLWGVNLWALQSWTVRIAALVAGVAIAFLPGPRRERPGLVALLLAASMLALWIAFPARELLFGDSADIARAHVNRSLLSPRSPLYVLYALRAGDVAGGDAGRFTSLLAGFSIACGVVAIAAAAWWMRRLGRPHRFAAAPLLLGGWLCLFQGYLESYALVALAWIVFALALEARAGWVRRAAVLGAQASGVGAHAVAVALLPVTARVALGRLTRRKLTVAAVALAGVAAVLLLARSSLPAGATYLDPVAVARFAVRQVAVAFTNRPWSGPLGAANPLQVVDIVNGLLLAGAPAILIGGTLLAFPASRAILAGRRRTALGAAALLVLAARALTRTPLGPILDWDLFVVLGVPLLLVTAAAWSDPRLAAHRRAAGWGPLVAAAITIVPVAAALRSPDASLERVRAALGGTPSFAPYVAAQMENRVGDELTRRGDRAAAADAFQRAWNRYPLAVYARREAQTRLDLRQTSAAMVALNHALEADPDDHTSRLLRAGVYQGGGNLAAAGADYEDLLYRDPGNPEALFGSAGIAAIEGDTASSTRLYDEAAAAFRRSLSDDPHREAYWRKLALTLLSLNRNAEAHAVLDTLIARFPAQGADYYHRGICEVTAGDLAAARLSFEKAHELDPDQRVVTLALARVLGALGETARAIALFDDALAAGPEAPVFVERGRLLLRAGRTADARADAGRALALDPGNAEARSLLQAAGR